jgi:RecB family endonuclease NucS
MVSRESIRVDRQFSLFARCTVDYHGRARSSLGLGNYLIIRKGDGSLMIHGASKLRPLNYQPSGAVLTNDGNRLISKTKNETIIIIIDQIINYYEYNGWTDNKIDICMTENDLREQIIQNINNIIGENITEITKEFITPYGPVDILAVGSKYHVIEVKRGKSSIQSCIQLLRYLDYFKEINQPATGWLMSPKITDNAKAYLKKRDCKWVSIQHNSGDNHGY